LPESRETEAPGSRLNICYEYATKRYRSNLINWGIIPFTIDRDVPFDYDENTYIYVPDIRAAIEENRRDIPAKVISGDKAEDITLLLSPMTEEEKAILLEGCLINYYAAGNGANKF
jgi:aconitate hydratase